MNKKKERKNEEKKNVKSWLRHLSIFMAMKKNMKNSPEDNGIDNLEKDRMEKSQSCVKHLKGEYV